jgi:large subunit ribosomal protein L13
MYKTYQPKAKDIKRNWHLVDARDKVLGRLSTEIAIYLMGKHKSGYSTHMDSGDYVVVINAKDVRLTGNKENQKTYVRHSGYPGGYKEIKISKLRSESPAKIIEHSVSGMLPENRLKRKRLVRLKVFSEENHLYNDKFGKKEVKNGR